MKVFCLILCAVMLMAMITGCAVPSSGDPTDTQPTDQRPSGGALKQPRLCDFEYQCIDQCGRSDDEGEDVVIIRSAKELQDYCKQNEKTLNDRFVSATAGYDSEFFSAHTLLLLPLSSTTNNDKHKISNVVQQVDGNYTVYLDWIKPEVVSPAGNEWHILVEVDGCIAPDAQVMMQIDYISEGNK